tara:strand:+ start:10546 stop:10827 length:282 start_codon:yes stop_codon:yes gene_type:complete
MKELTKKISPKFNGNLNSLNQIVQRIYDDINEVINAVNRSEDLGRSSSKGKPGDIRVVNFNSTANETSEYRLEVFTKDGWAKTGLSLIDDEGE